MRVQTFHRTHSTVYLELFDWDFLKIEHIILSFLTSLLCFFSEFGNVYVGAIVRRDQTEFNQFNGNIMLNRLSVLKGEHID